MVGFIVLEIQINFIDEPSMPKLLLSESDFCNEEVYKPNPTSSKIYDFIYVCLRITTNATDGLLQIKTGN